MTACAFPDCPKPIKSRGYCDAHYHQLLRGTPLHPVRAVRDPICTVPDCGRPHFAKGLCSGHYEHARQGHEPRPLHQPHIGCDFPGCDRPHRAKGLCSTHWKQQRDGVELRPLGAHVPRTKGPKASKPKPRKDQTVKFPKGWDQTAPKPKTPVAPVARFMRLIPPGDQISPELADLALRGLHRWQADDLAVMLGIEAA